MENDHIILNVDSDNRRIELNLFKEITIIEIIDELIDKKEIIIVYDDKIKEYADYLFDLISTKENIDAARWSIKEYEQSKASISSKNYTIFIGNNELIQNKIKFISKFQFDENGQLSPFPSEVKLCL